MQFNVQSQGELQIKTGYLGMAMTYVDQRQVIPYINSFDGFEYRMASAANRMLGEDKKTVAFLTGHGEQGPSSGYRTFAGLLLDSYRVVELDTTEDPNIDLSEVDVLIIAGPNRSISDETTDAIRQYLLGGGKAMMLIDTVEIDQGRLVATRNRNSFARMPEEFGVVVEEDLALDIESNETLSFSTQVGNVFLPYPFWVRAPVVDRKVAGNIESALLPWASSLGISESVHGAHRGGASAPHDVGRGDDKLVGREFRRRAAQLAGLQRGGVRRAADGSRRTWRSPWSGGTRLTGKTPSGWWCSEIRSGCLTASWAGRRRTWRWA